MKKVLLLVAAVIMAVGAMQAKTADEVRIYINPGHGSWGSGDRPMATIPYPMLPETGRPDTCGFYESNTNLWKCLRLGEVLQRMGIQKENIMYSRVANGPYPHDTSSPDIEKYNRNLSEIAREVDANNMDMFISIHSNAATDGTNTNYPLFLYRGQDYNAAGFEENPGSRDMCLAAWPNYWMDEIDPCNYYGRNNPNVRGDWNFYGSTYQTTTVKGTFTGYLGVLRHGTPGFLVEGYFHTYQPARHRALNPDYCYQEGTRAARGVCQYFGLTPEATGYIMGTVKDVHEKINNSLFKYNPGTNDQWLPINGATVKCMKGEEVVATYTVDNNYNGVFVFQNLAPGNYKLVAEHENYKTSGDYTEGTISKEYVGLMETSLGEYEVTANATTYAKLYLENKEYVAPTVAYQNYPDPVVSPMITGVAPSYNVNTLVDKGVISALANKTVRRALYNEGKVVVLALDAEKAPYIYQIDPKTQTVVKEISTAGTQGSELALSDIAFTSDGYLVGCNKQATAYSNNAAKLFRVYKWDKELEEAPAEWFTSTLSGNFYDAINGQSLAFAGSTKEGRLITSAVTIGDSKVIRILRFSIEDGNMAAAIRNQDASLSEKIYGEDFTFAVSPRSEENYIMDGSLAPAMEFAFTTDGKAPEVLGTMDENIFPIAANNANYFKFAGKSVMVAPVMQDGKVVEIKAANVTEGFDKAKEVKFNALEAASAPKKIVVKDAEVAAYATAAGRAVVTTDANDNVETADIQIVLVSDSVVSLYTTENTEQPTMKGIFAYDLQGESTADTYTFKFKTNGDAESADIVLKAEGEENIVFSTTDVNPAGTEVIINRADIPENKKYNWEVVIPNPEITTVSKFWSFVPTGNGSYCSRGMAIDNNPESPYFQQMYVSNPYGTKGIYVIDPKLEVLNPGAPYLGAEFAAGNTASPFRLGVNPNNGYVYIADWSDAHSGLYIMNPAEPTTATQFFEGSRIGGDGIFQYEGTNIGGGTTGVGFIGTGADTKLVTFLEDCETANQQILSMYAIGEDLTTKVGPAKTFPTVSAKMVNTNVNVVPLEDGMFVAQVRGSGNNTTGVPAFVYADYDDNIVFNSAEIAEDLDGNYGAGVAITPDRATFATATGKPYVSLWDVAWDGNKPSFTKRYIIPEARSIINQMQFDQAGNLIVACAKYGIYGLSIPKEAQDVVTPAKKSLLVSGVTSAVDDVTTAKTVAGVKYYNVMGVESNKPFDGVNIVVTTYTDGTTSTAKVRK